MSHPIVPTSASSQDQKPSDSQSWLTSLTSAGRYLINIFAENTGGKNSPVASDEIAMNLLNPTIFENALSILKLTEEASNDATKVNLAYSGLIKFLKEKKEKVPLFFANAIEQQIEQANQAHRTILTTKNIKIHADAQE